MTESWVLAYTKRYASKHLQRVTFLGVRKSPLQKPEDDFKLTINTVVAGVAASRNDMSHRLLRTILFVYTERKAQGRAQGVETILRVHCLADSEVAVMALHVDIGRWVSTERKDKLSHSLQDAEDVSFFIIQLTVTLGTSMQILSGNFSANLYGTRLHS